MIIREKIVNKHLRGYKKQMTGFSLSKKVVVLLLSSCFILSACEKAESTRKTGEVQLLKPGKGVAVSVKEDFRVSYDGFATKDDVQIFINGVLCDDAADPGSSSCQLVHNRAYGMASASIVTLSNVVVQGTNEVEVVNSTTSKRVKLYFDLDTYAPKLIVNEIEVVNDVAPLSTLSAGDEVVIRGVVKDTAKIKWFGRNFAVMTNSGGNFALQKVCNLPENTDQGCIAGSSFTVDEATNEFEIAGIKWPDETQKGPHFFYEIKDFYNQTGSESFIVNGGRLDNSFAFQVNDKALGMLNPLVDEGLAVGNQVLDSLGLGLGGTSPREVILAVIGLYMNGVVFPMPGYANVKQFSETYMDIGSANRQAFLEGEIVNFANMYGVKGMLAPMCQFLWGESDCYMEIVDVGFNNPSLLLEGVNQDRFSVRAGLNFSSLQLLFRLYKKDSLGLIDKSQGYFSSRLELNDFFVSSDFVALASGQDGCDSDLLCLHRQPARLRLHSSVWGNKQIFLRDSRCVGMGCGDRAGQMEIGWNSVTYLPKFVLWITGLNNLKTEILSIQDSMEEKLEEALASIDYVKINNDSTVANSFASILSLSKISSKKANPFPFVDNIRNGFFGFSSSGSLSTIDVDGFVDNPSLGSVYNGKNGYGYAKAGYPTRFGGQYVDFAFAVSADSLNQQLNELYQLGEWNNYKLSVIRNLDASGEPSPYADQGVNDICVYMTAKKSPTVQFVGYYSKKTSFDWELSGSTLLDTSKQDRPGSAKLIFDDVSFNVYDCTNENNPVLIPEAGDIAANASFRVSMYREGGKPRIVGYETYPLTQFAKLNDDAAIVIQPKDAGDVKQSNKLAHALEIALNRSFEAFNQDQASFVDIFELPGIGDIFENYLDATRDQSWWLKYKVNYQSFGIEPSGSYFSAVIRVDKERGRGNAAKELCKNDPAGIYRTYCLTH